MRKVVYVTLLLASVFSCTSDVELESNMAVSSLDQTWSLNTISGGLAGINLDYEQNEVHWTFNSVNNTLEVQNNIVTAGPKSTYGGPPTGFYNYTLDPVDSILFIENLNRGKISITTSGLTIDDGVAADGLLTEFIPISAFQ